jgi:hypothetical protein
MKRLALAALAVLLMMGCGGKKAPPPEDAETAETAETDEREAECDVDGDCGHNEMCIDGDCVSANSKAIYTRPSNAVTPEKVKHEVEKRTQAHEKRVDESLDL